MLRSSVADSPACGPLLLKHLDPSRSVMVIERNHVGFGASGRNGGWAVGELAAGVERYASWSSHEAAMRLWRAAFDAVDEIGRVASAEGIECGYAKGGTIRWARNAAQAKRQVEVTRTRQRIRREGFRLLTSDEASAIGNATDIHGGILFAHTAALDPAHLSSAWPTHASEQAS